MCLSVIDIKICTDFTSDNVIFNYLYFDFISLMNALIDPHCAILHLTADCTV